MRIWERRTRSNLYTPFFPRNSQNYQEKYPKGTRFSCLPWGFQHEGLSLRHNQTQSYTITCADHMISQKDTFSSCLFSILSTFMFPFSAQTGDFNGEFILINRMVDLQNPREHRHPPRERSPVHMTWRNSPPCEPNCGALLFLIHFSLFQNTAAFFLFGFFRFRCARKMAQRIPRARSHGGRAAGRERERGDGLKKKRRC